MIDLSHIAEGLRGLAVEVDSLHADPANARKGHAVERIAASLRQYGQRKPIVVNRLQGNKVEAGNGTLSAARLLGWSHVAAVFVEDDAATATGFGIADNRTGDLSEWDLEALDSLLGSIDPDEIFTGFEAGELDDLLEEAGKGKKGDGLDAEPQIDRAEELRQEWGVELGQLWRLPSRTPGQEHRLICGDCTDAAVVERVMGGDRAVVISDPPYGVAVVQNNSVGGVNLAPVGFYHPVIGDDSIEAAKRFYAVCLELGLNDIILWGGNYFSEFLPSKAGWIVWDKRGDIPSNNFADCELAWTSRDAPARVYKQVWMGMVKERESGKRVHPTQKPVELIQFCMGLFDAPIVFDGFLGSGTTIIAAENLSRQCRAVELSPGYVAVALQRYLDAFGIRGELFE